MTKSGNLTPMFYILGLYLAFGGGPASSLTHCWACIQHGPSALYWDTGLSNPNLPQECQGARQPLSLAPCSRLKGSYSPCLACSTSLSSQASAERRTLLQVSLSSVSLLGPGRQSWGRRWQGVILRGPPQIPLWLLSGLPWDNWPQMAVFPHALGCWVTRLCGAGCMPHHKRPRFP